MPVSEGVRVFRGRLGAFLRLSQVFAKGAKFSMFKPAEEMVYIGLDEQSRTKGKAAIDVVGAQTGKSIGSVIQQVSSLPLSPLPACLPPRQIITY